jgi:hypothetical protein
LSSKAIFSYNPTIEEMKTFIAKKKGKNPKDYENVSLTEEEK